MTPSENYTAAVERYDKAADAFAAAQTELIAARRAKWEAEREYLRDRFPTAADVAEFFGRDSSCRDTSKP